jgi:hypothetical protein
VALPTLLAVLGAVALAGCGGAALQVRSGHPAKSPADSTVVVDCGGYAQVAPVELLLSCRVHGPTLRQLKWRKWGAERASAVGRLTSRCDGCAGPATRQVRVDVAKRVLRRDATLAYRSLVITLLPTRRGQPPHRVRYELFDGYLERSEPS